MSETIEKKGKKGCLKGCLIFGVIALIVLAVGGYFLNKYAKKYSSPDFIVSQIESQMNCRASLEGVNATGGLLAPLRLEINNFGLSVRDEMAKNGIALSERTPVNEFAFFCKKLILVLNTEELNNIWSKKLKVNELIIEGLKLKMGIDEYGNNSMLELFQTLESAKNTEEKKALAANNPENKGNLPMTVNDIPLNSLKVAKVQVKDSEVYVTMLAENQSYVLENLKINVNNIALNGENLKEENGGDFTINGLLKIIKETTGEQLANLPIESKFTSRPFSPETKILEPFIKGSLTLKKGGTFQGIPAIKQINQKIIKLSNVSKLNFAQDLEINQLSQDAVANFQLKKNVITFTNALNIHSGNYLLNLNESSWVNLNKNLHEMEGRIYIAEDISQSAITNAKKEITRGIKELRDEDKLNELFSIITEPNGKRIMIEFASSGDIANPNVKEKTTGIFVEKARKAAVNIGIDKLKEKGLDSINKKLNNKLDNKLKKKITNFLDKLQ